MWSAEETARLRNSFLAGALELRSGIPTGAVPKSTGPDLVRALSTLQFLDYLGIGWTRRGPATPPSS